MSRNPVRALSVACAVGLVGTIAATSHRAAAEDGHGDDGTATKHVLLLSIDGLHQSDLAWYTAHHPGSALAALVANGVEFTNARTPFPSDSFPGMTAQVTGGNPSSTGIYYDDSWNRALLPAGTSVAACKAKSVPPGAEVTYFEAADINPLSLDAGAGLAGLPGSILSLTGNATSLIDPSQLPVDPTTCKPVYPHSYLKVNTVFEVIRAAGMRTAWSDKHPAYELLNGPSGTGVQDLFTPEINSNSPVPGDDWTKINTLTQQYDSYKAQAVINEIDGFDHTGKGARVGTPAIFGMNFQTVSTAEKLLTSGGQPGGYLGDGVTPGPVLSGALDYIDGKVAAFVGEIKARGLDRSTVVILSAKHGQSPDDPAKLNRIKDGPIIDALNAAWKQARSTTADLVAFAIDDDGMLLWLNDRSASATKFAGDFLLQYSGNGVGIDGKPKPFTGSGLTKVYAGEAAADYMKVAQKDARVPDVIGIAQVGTVYTGGSKIAEHGGANPQDRDVPLVVSGAPVDHHQVEDDRVESTQIAPTILRLLGLDPGALKAVQIEHTRSLPVS